MFESSSTPSATDSRCQDSPELCPAQLAQSMAVVLAKTSAPRQRLFRPFGSLMAHLSPKFCTTPARYRASPAHIFGHLFEANFEVLSLHRVRSYGPPRVGVPNPLPVTTATSEGVDQRRG